MIHVELEVEITGNPDMCWGKALCPIDFPFNQSIDLVDFCDLFDVYSC